MMMKIRRLTALCALALMMAGCEMKSSSSGKLAKPAPTPAEVFEANQKMTMTPNGRIQAGSASESNGKIQYKTEDGSTWQTSYEKRPDGTYHYGTPEKVGGGAK